jgi:hypothetical protein
MDAQLQREFKRCTRAAARFSDDYFYKHGKTGTNEYNEMSDKLMNEAKNALAKLEDFQREKWLNCKTCERLGAPRPCKHS